MDGLCGDERNVLLTLARMWRTAATGEFVAKDVAATWALRGMPLTIAATLAQARDTYLGKIEDDWTDQGAAVLEAAKCLRARVLESIGNHTRRLL